MVGNSDYETRLRLHQVQRRQAQQPVQLQVAVERQAAGYSSAKPPEISAVGEALRP